MGEKGARGYGTSGKGQSEGERIGGRPYKGDVEEKVWG